MNLPPAAIDERCACRVAWRELGKYTHLAVGHEALCPRKAIEGPPSDPHVPADREDQDPSRL
jgi:hypothetical protein